jgi:hypothetical protein
MAPDRRTRIVTRITRSAAVCVREPIRLLVRRTRPGGTAHAALYLAGIDVERLRRT